MRDEVEAMATNFLGWYIRDERLRRSLSYGDVARACGAVTPKQTSRISLRLVLFEREGVRDRRLLQKVVAALDLDPAHVNELLERQREEELDAWNRWADEPVPMELHVRPFAGFWYRQPLPAEIAANEALAVEHARRLTDGADDVCVVLALSRRRSLTFAGGQLVARTEATPGRGVTPFVTIGGQRIVFESGD